MIISITVRFFACFLISFEACFAFHQLKGMILFILLIIILQLLENKPIIIKKILLYAVLESINFLFKYYSVYLYQGENILYCLGSSTFTILFQTSIFQNEFLTIIIVIKHICLWYFYNENKFENQNSNGIMPILFSIGMVCICTLYEKGKRSQLKFAYHLSKTEEKKNLQISELLRLFQDGLIIINQSYNIQYKNETAHKLIKNGSDSFMDELKTKKFQDGRLIFECIHNIKFDSNQSSISLGIAELNDLLYEWTIKAVNWNDSLNFMIVIKDVTSILKMERITSENNAKSALIRSVSHELRTPVNGIMLLVESLLQDANESIKEKLLNIKTCAELLTFQISDILDYSEIISKTFNLNKSCCNLKTCLKESIGIIEYQAKIKGVNLLAKIDELIPDECFTDSYRIKKIVINLLTNAIKYTNNGSIELDAIHSGYGINISIIDTGIGIQQDRIRFIFNMFSDKRSGMSGLGLHISNSILNYLGSSMKVWSEENKGSTFSFSLDNLWNMPIIELSNEIDIPFETTSLVKIPNILINTLDKEHPKVLIVDDNDFNRFLLANILKANQIPYIEAANGSIAVENIIKFDKLNMPIACIIMDCDMPVMDGWEASKLINEQYIKGIIHFLPAIIGHTAYSSESDIKKCYGSGMISHIIKPTNQAQILNILRKYI